MVGSSHEATNRAAGRGLWRQLPLRRSSTTSAARTDAASGWRSRCRSRPACHELLAELKARRIPTAVATSSRAPHALGHLGAAGLLDDVPGHRDPRRRASTPSRTPSPICSRRAGSASIPRLPRGRGFAYRASAPPMPRACRPSWCPTSSPRPTRSRALRRGDGEPPRPPRRGLRGSLTARVARIT